MASPFKRPDIAYKPQVGEVFDPPVLPEGEEGRRQAAAEVSAVISLLIDEVKAASNIIEESLSTLAISDGDGILTSMVQSALSTEKPPTSVSYHTYTALEGKAEAAGIRSVFESKAYSVWGDASIALVEALKMIASEAIRAKNYLDEGVVDEKIISSLEKWVGHARAFTVDATTISSAIASDDLKNEVSIYADKAMDVQKSAIIGASVIAGEVNGNLSRIQQLYSSGNVYDSIVDTGPTVSPVTSGLVASMLDLHVDVAGSLQDDLSRDIDYRTEAFIESSNSLLAAVAKLRSTQMINAELSGTGVSELEVDDVVTTKPDVSYDQDVLSKIRDDEDVSSGNSLTLARVMKQVEETITIPTPSADLNASWHTKSLHDGLGIDAAKLEGKTAAEVAALAAPIGHNHDTNYLGITSKAADSSLLDGIDSTGFITTAAHTKAAHDALLINADTLDTKHAADFILKPIDIVSSTDLNSLTTPGMYSCSMSSTAATLTNCPTTSAFSLFVEKHAGTKQILTNFSTSVHETWVRNLYNGTWGSWIKLVYATDAVTTEFSTLTSVHSQLQNFATRCWYNPMTGLKTVHIGLQVIPGGSIAAAGAINLFTMSTSIPRPSTNIYFSGWTQLTTSSGVGNRLSVTTTGVVTMAQHPAMSEDDFVFGTLCYY